MNGLILRKVMDAPVRQIAGYPGSNEQRMAVERGELEGNCASWSALPPEWMTGKKVNVFTRFSTKRPADMPDSVPISATSRATRRKRNSSPCSMRPVNWAVPSCWRNKFLTSS